MIKIVFKLGQYLLKGSIRNELGREVKGEVKRRREVKG